MRREAIVAEALGWVGTPYRHQGRRRQVGCDCLGLVLGVWRAVYGVESERPGPYSADWAEAGGRETLREAVARHCREIAADAMAPGDLILFRWRDGLPAKHAGILVTPDRFVHAYEGRAVTVSPLHPHWRARLAAAFAFPDV